jgi:hypothetical protein
MCGIISFGKMELAQISINFEGLFVSDGGKILRKIRSLRKQCGKNPFYNFQTDPALIIRTLYSNRMS